jgi:hypothetical protein
MTINADKTLLISCLIHKLSPLTIAEDKREGYSSGLTFRAQIILI